MAAVNVLNGMSNGFSHDSDGWTEPDGGCDP